MAIKVFPDCATFAEVKARYPLEKIGEGARRVCYRIGETGYCVKFMRDPATTQSSQRFGWRFRYALKHYRFNRCRNINCLEAEAMEKYRRIAGPEVAAALPDVVEIVCDEQMGYGILMTFLRNADGSRMISADYEMARRNDPTFAHSCIRQISSLIDRLVACSAPFFEPDNFDAQIQDDGTPRIRLIDFEPTDKKLIPVGEWFSAIRRRNLKRKAVRYLNGLREKYGII